VAFTKFRGIYSLTHSRDYYGIPRNDSMISYWIVETHCDKIPLTAFGYKNHKSIKRQIRIHLPDTVNITFIHENKFNRERLNLI